MSVILRAEDFSGIFDMWGALVDDARIAGKIPANVKNEDVGQITVSVDYFEAIEIDEEPELKNEMIKQMNGGPHRF